MLLVVFGVGDDGVAGLLDSDAAHGAEGGFLRDEARRRDAVGGVVHGHGGDGRVVGDLLGHQARDALVADKFAQEQLAQEGVQRLLGGIARALADELPQAAQVVLGDEQGAHRRVGLGGGLQEEGVARRPGGGDFDGRLGREDKGRRRHVGHVALDRRQVGEEVLELGEVGSHMRHRGDGEEGEERHWTELPRRQLGEEAFFFFLSKLVWPGIMSLAMLIHSPY